MKKSALGTFFLALAGEFTTVLVEFAQIKRQNRRYERCWHSVLKREVIHVFSMICEFRQKLTSCEVLQRIAIDRTLLLAQCRKSGRIKGWGAC